MIPSKSSQRLRLPEAVSIDSVCIIVPDSWSDLNFGVRVYGRLTPLISSSKLVLAYSVRQLRFTYQLKMAASFEAPRYLNIGTTDSTQNVLSLCISNVFLFASSEIRHCQGYDSEKVLLLFNPVQGLLLPCPEVKGKIVIRKLVIQKVAYCRIYISDRRKFKLISRFCSTTERTDAANMDIGVVDNPT